MAGGSSVVAGLIFRSHLAIMGAKKRGVVVFMLTIQLPRGTQIRRTEPSLHPLESSQSPLEVATGTESGMLICVPL